MKKLLLSLLILAMSILLAGCPKDDTDSTNIKTKGIRAYFKVLIKKDSVIASADLRVGGNTTLLNLTERESLLLTELGYLSAIRG
jgi:uncharacterized lipoprotein YehR (DUF1307 family)